MSDNLNIKQLKTEVYSRFVSQTGNHRSTIRDSNDTTQYDVIGTLLKGELLNIPTLITFNRHNNTYYEGYSGTIIPEAELAFGVFKDLTTNGLGRIESLRRFYEKKMPEKLRELQNKFRAGDRYIPNTEFEDVNLPVATHTISIDPKSPSAEEITLYDLDVYRAIASADEVGEGPTKSLLPQIEELRAPLMQYGLDLIPLTDLGPDDSDLAHTSDGSGRLFTLQYGGDTLPNLVTDKSGLDDFSNILDQALRAGGWVVPENRFPIPSGDSWVWHFQNKDGTVCGSLRASNSRVLFKV
jgi:hypothetical protein